MTKKKNPEDLKKTGRPNTYNPQIAEEICDAIATSRLSLRALCDEHPHWPEPGSIFRWMIKFPEFGEKYAKAKEQQVEVSVDYMQEMANEPHHYIDDNGNQRIDVGLLRVKIDTVKWHAGKLKAKKYGENRLQEISNAEIHEDSLKRKQDLDEKYKKEY